MLKKIILKNFRQHTDKTIDFKDGFNLIRGANESGKSTVLSAAAYALYGSKALSESLDSVVTWDQPVNSLKVTLEFEFAGVDYTITRGKAGAEVKFGSELITGQTETVKFVETLFGVNADVASKLMLANQGTIRGALEGGPKATMELIESLADFDIIENLVERMQEKLPTGNTKLIEDRIKTCDPENLVEPVKPDVEALEEALAKAQATYSEVETAHTTAKQLVAELQPKFDAFSTLMKQYMIASNALSLWPDEKQKLEDEIAEARKALVGDLLSDERLEEINQLLKQEEDYAAVKAVFDAVSKLPVSEVQWEGDLESLEAAKTLSSKNLSAAKQKQAELRGDLKVLEARRINETACGLCGKDLSEVPEVVDKNRVINEQVAVINAELELAETFIQAQTIEEQAFAKINTAGHSTIEKYADYLEVNKQVVPWEAKWKGDEPVRPDTKQARADLKAHEAEKVRLQRAQGAVEQAERSLVMAERNLKLHQTWMDENEAKYKHELQTVSNPYLDATKAQSEAEGKLRGLAAEVREAQVSLREKLADYNTKVAAYNSAKENFGKLREELEAMNFNNALIKKIKAARPKIADKLWAVVLSAVSHYFSAVRGKPSIVSKETSGFLVDGHPVTGLSGSTLDALGLAIRLALTKTFLPNIRFIVLDEAGAACDDQRETNMLGVLATCDFDQVLHVSHNDLGDAFATHVVQL